MYKVSGCKHFIWATFSLNIFFFKLVNLISLFKYG